jgi:hypothetical protein
MCKDEALDEEFPWSDRQLDRQDPLFIPSRRLAHHICNQVNLIESEILSYGEFEINRKAQIFNNKYS